MNAIITGAILGLITGSVILLLQSIFNKGEKL